MYVKNKKRVSMQISFPAEDHDLPGILSAIARDKGVSRNRLVVSVLTRDPEIRRIREGFDLQQIPELTELEKMLL